MVGAQMLEAVDGHPGRPTMPRNTSYHVSALGFRRKDERTEALRHKGYTCAISGRFLADPAKTLVMKHIAQLVADGFAEWDMLDNEDIQLRFNTGETFLLTETVIIRLA
jgi:hypothetical protein